MRVYISGKITGNKNYKEQFEQAKSRIRDMGDVPVSPCDVDGIIPDAKYEELMKIDMEILKMCDAVMMLSGWEESKGANREYGYALGRGMKILKEGNA